MIRVLFALLLWCCCPVAPAAHLGNFPLDYSLTFDATTYSPTTGESVDADSPPVYRIYENGTYMSLTGSMTLADASNTNGYYASTVTLSAVNGFEIGNTYTIRIVGAVTGIEGVASHTFTVVGYIDAGTNRTKSNVDQIEGADATDQITASTPTATLIRNAITGGAWPLSTDSNGRIRIVDGTGVGELDTTSGRVLADVTHSAGVALGTPGEEDGLPIVDGNGLIDINLVRVAGTPMTAPAGGFASQTLLNSVNGTANSLTSAVNGLPTLTRIELDDNSTQLAAILADTGTDIPDAINNIAVDPEAIITAMEEAGFAKESEPGAIEEAIEELPDELAEFAGGILTDVNQERIPKSRVWRLTPTNNRGLISDTKSIFLADGPATFAVDFTDDQYANGVVVTVADPVIAEGTPGGVTFSSKGRLGAQARFRITPVTAGTYKIRVTVTYDSGSKSTGEVILKVIE